MQQAAAERTKRHIDVIGTKVKNKNKTATAQKNKTKKTTNAT